MLFDYERLVFFGEDDYLGSMPLIVTSSNYFIWPIIERNCSKELWPSQFGNRCLTNLALLHACAFYFARLISRSTAAEAPDPFFVGIYFAKCSDMTSIVKNGLLKTSFLSFIWPVAVTKSFTSGVYSSQDLFSENQ
jgi:hypothetical protein